MPPSLPSNLGCFTQPETGRGGGLRGGTVPNAAIPDEESAFGAFTTSYRCNMGKSDDGMARGLQHTRFALQTVFLPQPAPAR